MNRLNKDTEVQINLTLEELLQISNVLSDAKGKCTGNYETYDKILNHLEGELGIDTLTYNDEWYAFTHNLPTVDWRMYDESYDELVRVLFDV